MTGIEKASILILSLEEEKSLEVLQQLTHEERCALGAQILSLQEIDPEAWAEVLSESGRVMSALAHVEGPAQKPPARKPFGAMRRSLASVFSRGNQGSPDTAQPITSPEDLAGMGDAELQPMLSAVDKDDLALALTVASEQMKSAVMRNLSPADLDAVEQRLQGSGAVRVREIEKAGQRIVETARHFAGGSS